MSQTHASCMVTSKKTSPLSACAHVQLDLVGEVEPALGLDHVA